MIERERELLFNNYDLMDGLYYARTKRAIERDGHKRSALKIFYDRITFVCVCARQRYINELSANSIYTYTRARDKELSNK
jgi:hypothetical protein